MNIYTKDGVWYAPKWTHPQTGVTHPAHSLRTKLRAEADQKWALERAGATAAALVHLPQREGAAPKLSAAFVDYLLFKQHGVAPTTLESYKGHAGCILATLGDWDLDALCSPMGAAALKAWSDEEIARLGRTHTVVKRLEALLKPAVRLARRKGKCAGEPLWPEVRSDYKAEGKRQLYMTPEQFAALRAELPDADRIDRKGLPAIFVRPGLWADIIVSTGMHDSDVSRFSGADWDAPRALWFRRNTKGAAHYGPEWFPADAYLVAAMARAPRPTPGAPWIASEVPPQQWMRQRLRWASRRAGLPFTPQPIDFRRTCATWLRDAGWEFDEVAKLLGNSTGMVREVYAQVPRARFVAAVAKAAPQNAALAELTRLLFDLRKGPARKRAKMVAPAAVVSPVVKPQTGAR